ncbi:hypothetical protein CH252_30910 [Rhodococcus sp. 06-1477-1B]|nr:hypothetical protein CH252_30910 [Rhodococcus sp. 06-1477-1B]
MVVGGCPSTTTFSERGIIVHDPQDRLMISDPVAVRAITRPVRLAALDELYRTQRHMTATELAAMVGITASAMSYHLRELESFGVIERSVDGVDGRERPWRAVARNYSLVGSDDPDVVDHTILVDARLTPMRERMLHLLRDRSRIPEAERSEPFMILATGDLLLTRDELAELQNGVDALWRRFEELSAARDDDPQYRRARYMWSCLPEHPTIDD